MNSINNTSIIQQSFIQQTQQAQQTQATQSASTVASTEQVGPSSLIHQDTSDVTRMGTSGRLRIKDGKEKEKENLGKIRRDLSPEKVEKAEQVEGKALNNFARRKRSAIDHEDKDYARRSLEELLQDLEGDFSGGEKAAILQNLKSNAIVMKDVLLQEMIENQITDMIQASFSTQIEIASAGIMPKDGILTGSEKRELLSEVALNYSTQEAYLGQLESKVGKSKLDQDFPAILSHTMADLSASMSSLSVAGGGEKGAVYAAASGISALQQMTGVYSEAARMLRRMSEYYPIKD